MLQKRDIIRAAKRFSIRHNVCIRVIEQSTGRIVQQHTGHNSATNSMLNGIAHYLIGDGTYNQGYTMLHQYVPKYISLGTMGLYSQNADKDGLPTAIGTKNWTNTEYSKLPLENQVLLGLVDEDGILLDRYKNGKVTAEQNEIIGCVDYMVQCPGYGADGYDANENNTRTAFGLGLPYTTYEQHNSYKQGDEIIYKGSIYRYNKKECVGKPDCDCVCCTGTVYPSDRSKYWDKVRNCEGNELISPTYGRSLISFRDVVPEIESELPQTIDVVFSAMISVGALEQFRDGRSYVYITEAGLWSKPDWSEGGNNGLLAGYRLTPSNRENWFMRKDDENGISDETAKANRQLLKSNILRVGKGQVVQVIWKIQLGSIDDISSIHEIYKEKFFLDWIEV